MPGSSAIGRNSSGSELNRAQRLFLPGIADLLFLGLFMTRMKPTLFHDGDTGWHLWAGTAMLDRGPGVLVDTLSFTRAGASWANVEWLGELLLGLLYRHAGYAGVAILCALTFAGTFAGLYRLLVSRTANPPAALLATVLAAQVTLIQFLARPLIFSFPIFLVILALLLGSAGARRILWAIPVLTALWANLHPSATLGPAMVIFFWMRRRDRLTGAAALLSLAALGATPWGYSWIWSMVQENRPYFGLVQEWASPTFGDLRFLPYLILLFLSLAARRGIGPRPVGEGIWGLGWLGAALVSARLGPYAAIAWAPFLARDLTEGTLLAGSARPFRWWAELRSTLGPIEARLRPGFWPVAIGAAALIGAPSLGPRLDAVARGFPPERFPAAALAEAGRRDLGPRVFNRYAWGGYISWVSEGRYRIFIDGRAGFFGAALLEDYLAVMQTAPEWTAVLERHHPDWLLVGAEDPVVGAAPATGAWSVVYRDSLAAILVPRESLPPVP